MKDPRRRFTETAELYDRFRPSYPPALLDWLGLSPGLRVLDVGCGTGISTRLLAARGCAVSGVDPNEAMLEKARARGGAEYRRGEAEATGLPDSSVDLVCAAQAFHWFEPRPALEEWRRVARPGGRGAAFWNEREKDTPFLRDYEALLLASSGDYARVRGQSDTLDALRAEGLPGWSEAAFGSAQPLDREALFGRVFSSSYVVHGVEDKPAFERALGALFDRHAEGGRVEFRYRTIAGLWVMVK